MPAWHVNNALDSWRDGINARYPKRRKDSDGTKGDAFHARSVSQHNPDGDGTVDAFDMDVNLLGSGTDTGSLAELLEIEKLKRVFEADPRSQLWIHNGQIANRDIGNWKRRPYSGPNKHDHHVHWETRQSKEDDGAPWFHAEEKPDMQLSDKVKLFNNPDVKYSSPETSVETILASTNYYTLQARNQAAREFAALKVTLAAILKASQGDADADRIMLHVDSAVNKLRSEAAARDAELRALVQKAVSGEATAEAIVQEIGERLAN
jgi:hypothetical protein